MLHAFFWVISPASEIYVPTFRNTLFHLHRPVKIEKSVPKRQYIKFRRRGGGQKKTYNILVQSFFYTAVNFVLNWTWLWFPNLRIFLFHCTSLLLVINPYTGLDRPWAFQEVKAPRFQNNRHRNMGSFSVLLTGHLYPPPANIAGTHFC
jgi:hypothetical protein